MKRLGLAAVLAGVLLILPLRQDVGAASTTNTAETYKELNLFGDVFEKVRSDYVDEVSDDTLIEGAINGMLTSLDPHSNYLNAKNFTDMKVQTRGEFGGLGIEVSMENGLIKVVSPIDDTPAARAGLKPGDLITHLDGTPVQGMTLPEAVEKMRGPINSEVTLRIRRTGKDPFDVKLTRATIKIQSVRSHLEGDSIGYVRITSFNEQTDVGLESAMKNLKQQAGNKLAGIVLDLRNNPGGLLDQAVAVSDDFLDKGEIVSTRGRRADDAQRYNAHAGDISDGLPMVVLINGGSASASEIVAGALQDHHRAILLGTRSFGKGSVQTIIPLPGHGAMRLTTARYYTPSGRSIQAKGIDPDIVVEAAKIEHPVDNAGAAAKKTEDNKDDADNPGDQATVDPSVIGTPDDYQLARAVDMLRGIALFGGQVRKLSVDDLANYRPGVGIALVNREGKVFVGRRIDMPDGWSAWQMPQGGIDGDETPMQAAMRELYEETGTDKAEIIAETRDWLHYDLPAAIAGTVWGGRYRGQRQKWFLMRFGGEDIDIDLSRHEAEFDAWKWVEPAELPGLIVNFKRPVYVALLEEFREQLGL